jgi:predicted peptidase
MDTVCYGTCISCGGINVNEETTEGFSIYPNPVQNSFLIQSANLVKAISIADNTGKRITLPTVALNNSVQVNTESLSTGIYHVQVVTAKGTTTQRFVKL